MFNSSRLLLPVLLGGSLLCQPVVLTTRAVAAPVETVSTVGVVDVSKQVAALVKNNSLEVTAETALAGADPAPKIVKRLVVIYTVDGLYNGQAAMEGEMLRIAAPTGHFKVEKALYGDIAFPVVNVTEKLRARIVDNAIVLPVNVDLAGVVAGQPTRDPAPGQKKTLAVNYRTGAELRLIKVDDGETLKLPLIGDANKKLTIENAVYGDVKSVPELRTLLKTAFPPANSNAMKPMTAQTISLSPPALQTTPIAPAKVEKRGAVLFADFGLDYFGNLQITLPADAATANVPTTLTIRFGEKLSADGTIDRKPGGSISFVETTLETKAGQTVYQPQIPFKGGAQSSKAAIKLPPEIGNITPFRYVEIEGAPAELGATNLKQIAVHTAFDDDASSFVSSDETLNAVWDLCKHTMKATTAFGVYVDGERERLPYEADAYINMMSHFAVDLNPEVARYTTEYLLKHPTWPTEWSFHMPMMAAQEYRATGDKALAARNYDALVKKLMMDKARASDGLLRASAIVDWPAPERDGYNDGVVDPDEKKQVGPMINTVANAFYYHSLREMAFLARSLDKTADANDFDAKAAQIYQAFNSVFFDETRGIYIDGEGSNHASLHANMFALAFDLVPDERQKKVADFVQSRGMAASVYGAQYLLEALYKSRKADYALSLMTSRDQRSWFNMIRGGSTMTWEAWDPKFKGNLTWNHAWGAAPANIIARYVVGVAALTPGYEKILIAPQPGTLTSFDAKIPTARGPVKVKYERGNSWQIEVPPGTTADVELPFSGFVSGVIMDGKKADFKVGIGVAVLQNVAAGAHTFKVDAAK